MADDIWELLARCTGFQWDEANAPKVLARHAVLPGECEQVFFTEPFLVVFDDAHSATEPRWHGLGRTAGGRLVHVVFTIRGDLIRVIGARDMSRKERRHYAEVEKRSQEDPGV